MEKIMGLAKSLSGDSGESNTHAQQAAGFPGLGDMDPKMLGTITRILSEFSSQRSEKAALVEAMKPFLREARYNSLSKALAITKIARAARTVMAEMGGEKLV